MGREVRGLEPCGPLLEREPPPVRPIVEGEPRRRRRGHRDHLDLRREDLEREVGAAARQEADPESLTVGEEPGVERRPARTEPARQLVDGEMADGDEVQGHAGAAVRHSVILWVSLWGVNRAAGARWVGAAAGARGTPTPGLRRTARGKGLAVAPLPS